MNLTMLYPLRRPAALGQLALCELFRVRPPFVFFAFLLAPDDIKMVVVLLPLDCLVESMWSHCGIVEFCGVLWSYVELCGVLWSYVEFCGVNRQNLSPKSQSLK